MSESLPGAILIAGCAILLLWLGQFLLNKQKLPPQAKPVTQPMPEKDPLLVGLSLTTAFGMQNKSIQDHHAQEQAAKKDHFSTFLAALKEHETELLRRAQEVIIRAMLSSHQKQCGLYSLRNSYPNFNCSYSKFWHMLLCVNHKLQHERYNDVFYTRLKRVGQVLAKKLGKECPSLKFWMVQYVEGSGALEDPIIEVDALCVTWSGDQPSSPHYSYPRCIKVRPETIVECLPESD